MKTKILIILICNLFLSNFLIAQSITNTLGTGGVFSIKNGTNTYLSLSQSNGYLNLSNCIVLPYTTSSNTGVIYKNSYRFIHNFGLNNTFMGISSGNFTMSGSNNTAIGEVALYVNTTGSSNVLLGNHTLFNNTTGSFNTSVGRSSLSGNTTGSNNTALGWNSLAYNTTGNNNICLGYNAQVPSGTSSNQVRIGNDFITYAGIKVAWSITSDRRWKENITASNLGLNFISKLNPVSYTRINDQSQKTEYGLIAQEVEIVLKEEGIDNSGLITKTDAGFYELRYNDLFAPVISAIKELKAENDDLKKENEDLKSRISNFELSIQKLANLEVMYNELSRAIEKAGKNETVRISESK